MIGKVFRFYNEGFRSMTWGRTLWLIIIVKLIVLFGILKIFFFPDVMKSEFKTEKERSNHVIENLTNIK